MYKINLTAFLKKKKKVVQVVICSPVPKQSKRIHKDNDQNQITSFMAMDSNHLLLKLLIFC